MNRCPDCQQQVIRAVHGEGPTQQTAFLEPGGLLATYVAVEADTVYPRDGDRVFLSAACILHSAVCPAVWRQRLERMEKAARVKKEKTTKPKEPQHVPA
jgi:hypothetical protein